MILKYINIKDEFYKKAVAIRIDSFFKDMPNVNELINDADEKNSIHIVRFHKNTVLGTGRLTLNSDIAIISQMAIHQTYRNQGIGSEILKALIDKSKLLKAVSIELSARETAISFYRKHGFEPFGELYPSKKTGIIHQKMSLAL